MASSKKKGCCSSAVRLLRIPNGESFYGKTVCAQVRFCLASVAKLHQNSPAALVIFFFGGENSRVRCFQSSPVILSSLPETLMACAFWLLVKTLVSLCCFCHVPYMVLHIGETFERRDVQHSPDALPWTQHAHSGQRSSTNDGQSIVTQKNNILSQVLLLGDWRVVLGSWISQCLLHSAPRSDRRVACALHAPA